MKVLFVCHGNVGRSQVAQVYFDQLSQHDSSCAGTAVDEAIARTNSSSRKIKDAASQRSAEYIQKEFGVDISERERLQLEPEMIEEADRVIVIDEKESWPDYLQEGGKVEFWDIGEPLGRDDAFVLEVFGQVRHRVEELAKELV